MVKDNTHHNSGNPLLDHALQYAEKFNLSVIPVGPDKKPYVAWAEYQTRRASSDEIKAWWGKWPNAMIGIVTGPISGLLVIDCDSHEGYDAIQNLLPDSLVLPVARTPRCGWHLYFTYPKGSKLTIDAGVLPGVDYRGEGGYIIAPPSVNGDGKAYAWEQGLALGDVEAPPLPESIIKNINNKKHGTDANSKKPRANPNATFDGKFFAEGRRDDDLFHASNCLIKGGGEVPFVRQIIDILARNCTPPFSKREAQAKVESALTRAERRERNLTAEIREWVLTTFGNFLTTDVYTEQHLTTREEMKTANVILRRLCEPPDPLLERVGKRRGCYRRIDNNVEPVNFLTAPTDEFPITWPLGIHDLTVIYPGNVIVVAGSKSSGKTAFLLNVVRLNQDRYEIVYLNSEMGDAEFRKRLELFGAPLLSWKVKAYHRASDFADLITPERKLFIVDFLEVTTDFWKVAEMIQEIHRKLKDGICIIALQKSEGKDAGRGGDFSKEKSRLYLTLDYKRDEKVNRIKIIDAKAWRTEMNPRGMCRDYHLVHGHKFMPTGDWLDS